MEKLFKFLFVGSSRYLLAFKCAAWLMATLLLMSVIENGGNDGELTFASQLVFGIGLMLTALSVALTLDYERELDRKAKPPVKNTPPIGTLPDMPPPANYPVEPPFPNFPANSMDTTYREL